MIGCSLSKARRILCLGAHSDDIEIGCGGTLLKLASQREVEVMWVVLSAEGVRATEAKSSAKMFLRGVEKRTIVTKDFRTSFFPFQGEQIKEYFETLKQNATGSVKNFLSGQKRNISPPSTLPPRPTSPKNSTWRLK